MPKLIVQQGYNERSEIEIVRGEMIVGRDPACQLVLPDGEVSRQHAKLLLDDQGVVRIEDLGSYNGTFLNWTPVSGQAVLKHLDVLQICKNVFVFIDSGSAADDSSSGRHKTQEIYTVEFLRELVRTIQANVERVFMGKSKTVRDVLLCLLADGHVLIEDAPGVGKTILAQAVAKSIQGTFKRIQFTPDMLPADITGITVFEEKSREFRFIPGAIFGNLILADEINRATPRTQSSLLECMSDAVVTIDGTAHVLPKPFFVIATQNPSHFHGTYPLPEAQLDRFLMRLSIGYPDVTVERSILTSQVRSHPISGITYVAKTMDLVQCQAVVRSVHVAEPVKDYIVKIAHATRAHPALAIGVSPRASLSLMRAAQALAACQGRRYVLPSDVRELAPQTLAHRVQIKLRAQTEVESSVQIIEEILNQIPIDDHHSDVLRPPKEAAPPTAILPKAPTA